VIWNDNRFISEQCRREEHKAREFDVVRNVARGYLSSWQAATPLYPWSGIGSPRVVTSYNRNLVRYKIEENKSL